MIYYYLPLLHRQHSYSKLVLINVTINEHILINNYNKSFILFIIMNNCYLPALYRQHSY